MGFGVRRMGRWMGQGWEGEEIPPGEATPKPSRERAGMGKVLPVPHEEEKSKSQNLPGNDKPKAKCNSPPAPRQHCWFAVAPTAPFQPFPSSLF